MVQFRRIIALILLNAILCIPCAHAEDAAVALPEPPPAQQNMILGESGRDGLREVTLYFANENITALTSSTRTIRVEMDESLAEAALDQLLTTGISEGIRTSLSPEEELISLEFACGIATANFSIDASAHLSDQAKLMRSMAIANTLLSIEGVEGVNILTGSQSDAISALPVGVFTQINNQSSTQYAQMQSEQESFTLSHNGRITRSVQLYFPSDNNFFLPELQELHFSDKNYAAVILKALEEGPLSTPGCTSPFPVSDKTLYDPPFIWINDAGERILQLNFSDILPNHLAFSGMEPWQFYGSLTLTLCSFLPNLDGVRMSIEGITIGECAIDDRIIEFSGGVMRRSDFTSKIGSNARLYFADQEGNLVSRECPVSQSGAATMRGVLTAMITASVPEGLVRVFPEGITPEDILGVELLNGVATVNLSGSFYACCQHMDAAEERRLIYAMVNSLCTLPDVGAVSFLVEGRALEYLSHDIYLKSYLMPDPGSQQQPAM